MTGNMLILFGILITLIGFMIIIFGITFGARPGSGRERDRSYEGEGSFGRKDYFENTANFEKRTDFGSTTRETTAEGKYSSKVKGGGVIMLGPIPIIFGSDGESAKTAIILAILLMLLTLIMFRNAGF